MLSPPSGGQTTVPSSSDTCEPGVDDHSTRFGLVLIWSPKEPHRQGEGGFPIPGEWLYLGRGDDEDEMFMHLARHLPGQPPPKPTQGRCLVGDGLSRRQGILRVTEKGIEYMNIGQCPTFVNGVELKRVEGDPMAAWNKPGAIALLQHRHVLRFQGAGAFVCVLRHKMLPVPDDMGELHELGAPDDAGLIGESEQMWQFRRELRIAARRSRKHVLMLGETGTGKSLASGAIHRYSKRASGPHIVSSSIEPSLARSEIFGNAPNYPNKGDQPRKGLFGAADGGTLFLDEIGDLPANAQDALLGPLESGDYQTLGEAHSRHVDVRVVGATSKDESSLRKDLRMRLRMTIRSPALRERPEDIPLLARHLLLALLEEDPSISRFFRKGPTGRLEVNISGRLVEYLVRHELPGNVRDLDALLMKAVDGSRGNVIRLPEADGGATPSSAPPAPPKAAPELESDGLPTKAALRVLLEEAEWNVSLAGRRLGLHRNAMHRLMEKRGIKRERTRPY